MGAKQKSGLSKRMNITTWQAVPYTQHNNYSLAELAVHVGLSHFRKAGKITAREFQCTLTLLLPFPGHSPVAEAAKETHHSGAPKAAFPTPKSELQHKAQVTFHVEVMSSAVGLCSADICRSHASL